MTQESLLIPSQSISPLLGRIWPFRAAAGEVGNRPELGNCKALTENSLEAGLQPSNGGLD